MRPGAAGGWQTILADLSLILFVVTLAAVGVQATSPAPARADPDFTGTVALSVYRQPPGLDASALRGWLADARQDERQTVVIAILHDGTASGRARAEADAVAAIATVESATRGRPVPLRLTFAAGEPGLEAMLAYDGLDNAAAVRARAATGT